MLTPFRGGRLHSWGRLLNLSDGRPIYERHYCPRKGRAPSPITASSSLLPDSKYQVECRSGGHTESHITQVLVVQICNDSWVWGIRRGTALKTIKKYRHVRQCRRPGRQASVGRSCCKMSTARPKTCGHATKRQQSSLQLERHRPCLLYASCDWISASDLQM
jgi:hypothetical protein